jgi:hypothetical protein
MNNFLPKHGLYTFVFVFLEFSATFSKIMGTILRGGGSRSPRREPPTLGKQLVNIFSQNTGNLAGYLFIKAFIFFIHVLKEQLGHINFISVVISSGEVITNTAWVRAQLCKLQNRVHSTRSRK